MNNVTKKMAIQGYYVKNVNQVISKSLKLYVPSVVMIQYI